MLDPEVPDGDRDRIAAEARQRIEAGGKLRHDSAWGTRKMAYEIRQRTEADYRFFRFQTEGPLLDELDHNLKIADGVLRFRIFKVDLRAPMIVPPAPASAAAPRRDRREDGAAPAAEAEPQPTPPAEAAAPAAPAEAAPSETGPGEAAPAQGEPAAEAEAPPPPEPPAEAAEPAPEPEEASGEGDQP